MIEPTLGLVVLQDLIEYDGDRTWGLSLVKVQPPDGLVFRDPKGGTWGVSVHRLDEGQG